MEITNRPLNCSLSWEDLPMPQRCSWKPVNRRMQRASTGRWARRKMNWRLSSKRVRIFRLQNTSSSLGKRPRPRRNFKRWNRTTPTSEMPTCSSGRSSSRRNSGLLPLQATRKPYPRRMSDGTTSNPSTATLYPSRKMGSFRAPIPYSRGSCWWTIITRTSRTRSRPSKRF